MLVVSRTEGEAVTLPDLDVAVRVLRIAGSRVRIGVEAPEQIRVLRSELAPRTDALLDDESQLRREELQRAITLAQLELSQAQGQLSRGDLFGAEARLEEAQAQLKSVMLNSDNDADTESNEPMLYTLTTDRPDGLQVREARPCRFLQTCPTRISDPRHCSAETAATLVC